MIKLKQYPKPYYIDKETFKIHDDNDNDCSKFSYY